MSASLLLTPLVDMFSLLVVFLLQVFSASPQTIVVGQSVKLPTARTGQALPDAPVLVITQREVFLDQKALGPVSKVLADPSRLLRDLVSFRDDWQKSHVKSPFPGAINLEAHDELASTIVARFFGLLTSVQFESIHLMALNESGDSHP